MERNISVWEKHQERNMDRLPLMWAPTGDWTRNPGMCPDGKLNQWPFALQDNIQPTDPHWSELAAFLKTSTLDMQLIYFLCAWEWQLIFTREWHEMVEYN